MVMTWDNVADAKLFAAVIATTDMKLDYKKIAAIMGPECTAKAITHRITKIRELAKNFDTTASATGTPESSVKTPKTKAAKRKEDDEGDESPGKKPKTTTKSRKEPKVKPEPEIEDGDEGFKILGLM